MLSRIRLSSHPSNPIVRRFAAGSRSHPLPPAFARSPGDDSPTVGQITSVAAAPVLVKAKAHTAGLAPDQSGALTGNLSPGHEHGAAEAHASPSTAVVGATRPATHHGRTRRKQDSSRLGSKRRPRTGTRKATLAEHARMLAQLPLASDLERIPRRPASSAGRRDVAFLQTRVPLTLHSFVAKYAADSASGSAQ
jgi:hypothetical protein